MSSVSENSRHSFSRVFVVDYACIGALGHNAKCQAYFAEALRAHIPIAKALVTTHYCDPTSELLPVLIFPYAYVFMTDHAPFWQRSWFDRRLNRAAMQLGFDLKGHQLRKNWQGIFERFQLGPQDLLFFPSTDYYGASSLLAFLKGKEPSVWPAMHFRFINVAEHFALKQWKPRQKLLEGIAAAARHGRIGVSAETPPYCSELTALLGHPVDYFPYPTLPSEPCKVEGFEVSSPGFARVDKGFFRILPIAEALASCAPEASIRIVLQDMRTTSKDYDPGYSRALARMPNVTLLPERLTDEEIAGVMGRSSAFLLPYLAKNYSRRGSAIFQEAISFGRPVIASTGLGFSDLIERYRAGYLADTPEAFADRIVQVHREQLAGRPPSPDLGLYRTDFEKAISAALAPDTWN